MQRELQIGVLALQGDFEAHARMLRSAGAQPRIVRTPRDLDDLDGLIIPGGESTTMTLGIEREGLAAPLRELIAAGTPLLGTCAGMIMLDRQHLDVVDADVRRNAFGRQVRSFEADLTLRGFGPEPLRAVFIRAPWVERVGPDVETLAEHEGHAVAIMHENVLAVAFHPELSGDTRLHEWLLERATAGTTQAAA
jgi:pyridoxal 5'-phosphate synthase pdxT subunit